MDILNKPDYLINLDEEYYCDLATKIIEMKHLDEYDFIGNENKNRIIEIFRELLKMDELFAEWPKLKLAIQILKS